MKIKILLALLLLNIVICLSYFYLVSEDASIMGLCFILAPLFVVQFIISVVGLFVKSQNNTIVVIKLCICVLLITLIMALLAS